MLPQPDNGLVLPTVRLVLGICAILLSLSFSIEFISQGSSGAGLISAVIFCLITEFCKVAFTTDLAYYYQTRQADKALFAAVLVLILFALSISAAVFSLTINPARQETVINQADERITTLKAQIRTKTAQIAACNPSFVSKCINPRTQELEALQSEFNALLQASDKLLEAKATAAFWSKAAAYFKTNPRDLEFNFAIARAVLLDLLGLVLVSHYTSARRMQRLSAYSAAFETVSDSKPTDETGALLAEIEQLKLELAKKP